MNVEQGGNHDSQFPYEDHGAVTVLSVMGVLNVDSSGSFRHVCKERFGCGIRDFVLNLEALDAVDSVGLECLLWLQDAARELNGAVCMVKPETKIRRVLNITRLDKHFQIHETIESAARSLQSGQSSTRVSKA